MKDLALHIGDDLAGVLLVPVPVQALGHSPELDQEVTRQILGLQLAPLFLPEAE
jgi:hypothetical protein